jgi:hypothetical protein
LTGGEFLTGDLKWYLFQNENFPKVAATAVVHRMRCRPPTSSNAAIAVRCVFLILFVPIVDTTRVRKYWTLAKKQKRNKNFGIYKKTGFSPFLV